jgi:membrane protein
VDVSLGAHEFDPRAWARAAAGFGLRCFHRLIEFEVIDRSIVLASQAFTAGIPFMIVVGSIGPRGEGLDIASRVIRRFELHGSSADTVRTLFLPPTDVRATITWVGVVVLLFAVSSFTRTVQRLYERAWGLERAGMRGAWRGLVWLVGFVGYVTVIALLKGSVTAGADRWARGLAGIIPAFAFWLWTPHILLGPRVAWRRFVPVAALAATGMSILALATPLYMPHLVAVNAAKFGFIGVAFSLVSWLLTVAVVAVVSIVVGHQIDSELRGEAT